MDNLRTLFIFGLLIVSLLLWEAWQNDYVRPQQVATQSNTANDGSSVAPPQTQDDLPDLPVAVSADGLPALPDSGQVTGASANQIRVKTDVIDAMIDLQGADIRKLALLKYPVNVDFPDQPVQLLNDAREHFFVTQSGLRAEGPAPTHYETYTAEQSEYVLGDNAESLSIPLRWESDNGLTVIKTYTFSRDSYLVNVSYQIENQSGERFAAYPYAQFNRNESKDDSFFIYTYTGAVFSSQG